MDDNRKDQDKKDRLQEANEWKERYDGEEGDAENPRELFKQVSHISLYLAYDMIDKLRFWERETIKLSDEEIATRLDHLISSVEQLRVAYLDFADLEFD